MISIQAHYDGKVIVPDEPVDLPCDQTLVIRIEPVEPSPEGQAGSALEWVAENAVDDPEIPPDLADQHDHYLYGTPKRGE